MSPRANVYIVNNMGPRTLHCGTPRCSSTDGAVESRMATACVRSLKYDSNHMSAVPPRPMRCCSTLRSFE